MSPSPRRIQFCHRRCASHRPWSHRRRRLVPSRLTITAVGPPLMRGTERVRERIESFVGAPSLPSRRYRCGFVAESLLPGSTANKSVFASSSVLLNFLEHCCHCIVVTTTVLELHTVVRAVPYRHDCCCCHCRSSWSSPLPLLPQRFFAITRAVVAPFPHFLLNYSLQRR
ncbi:uncharacterized protein [Arachis hypogaea]|uniref:uncharacterized protein isoform X2 n=1 Tax=Arachis hypogaea TaxID=3818 RepID=UPI003B211A10